MVSLRSPASTLSLEADCLSKKDLILSRSFSHTLPWAGKVKTTLSESNMCHLAL